MLQLLTVNWGKRPILLYGTTKKKAAMPDLSSRSKNDCRPWWWDREKTLLRVTAQLIPHMSVYHSFYVDTDKNCSVMVGFGQNHWICIYSCSAGRDQ